MERANEKDAEVQVASKDKISLITKKQRNWSATSKINSNLKRIQLTETYAKGNISKMHAKIQGRKESGKLMSSLIMQRHIKIEKEH